MDDIFTNELIKGLEEDNYRIVGIDDFTHDAVLICLCKIDDETCLVLEKRAPKIRQGGEISFPGGQLEPADKTIKDTAIRETSEELGISKDKIKILGKYGISMVPYGFLIHCFVGTLDIKNIEDIVPQRSEVEKLLFVPIKFFIENPPQVIKIGIENISNEDLKKMNIPKKYHNSWKGKNRNVYFYDYKGDIIWGITGGIIHDFIKKMGKYFL